MTGPAPAGRPLGPHPPRSRMRSCLPEPTAPTDARSSWRMAVRVPESPALVGVRRRAGAGRAGTCSGSSLPERSEVECRARCGASLATLLAGNFRAGLFLKPALEEDDTYLDPCLLSYTDELRSREHSVTKVEAVIHPRFPAELFSPDPQLDVSALAEEPKQEEGLTPEEGNTVNSNTKVGMGECKRNKENRTSISQEHRASDEVAANALQRLEGRVRSRCSEGFSSAFLWGRFGAVASQCPKSHRQCGFRKDLTKN
ncbi:uncharacterized protein AAG666_007994 [Megaptera novaeangliae]